MWNAVVLSVVGGGCFVLAGCLLYVSVIRTAPEASDWKSLVLRGIRRPPPFFSLAIHGGILLCAFAVMRIFTAFNAGPLLVLAPLVLLLPVLAALEYVVNPEKTFRMQLRRRLVAARRDLGTAELICYLISGLTGTVFIVLWLIQSTPIQSPKVFMGLGLTFSFLGIGTATWMWSLIRAHKKSWGVKALKWGGSGLASVIAYVLAREEINEIVHVSPENFEYALGAIVILLMPKSIVFVFSLIACGGLLVFAVIVAFVMPFLSSTLIFQLLTRLRQSQLVKNMLRLRGTSRESIPLWPFLPRAFGLVGIIMMSGLYLQSPLSTNTKSISTLILLRTSFAKDASCEAHPDQLIAPIARDRILVANDQYPLSGTFQISRCEEASESALLERNEGAPAADPGA